MALLRLISAEPFEGIAEAHRSCVADILRATKRGLFTQAEADLLIGRVRTLSVVMTDGP
jgi:hypothetical protein